MMFLALIFILCAGSHAINLVDTTVLVESTTTDFMEDTTHLVNATDQTVDYSEQNLVEIPVQFIPCSTQKLNLSSNQLTALENGTFNCLSNLTSLSVSDNSLSVIQPLAFAGLSLLKDLDLSDNELMQWPEFSSSCLSLHTLNVSNNQLGQATNNLMCLKSLEILKMNNNGFETFPDLTDVGENIKKIYIRSNPLTAIIEQELAPLKSIKRINLQENELKSCSSFDSLNETLEQLHLRGNPLEEMEECVLRFADSGSEVDLPYNHFTHLPQLSSLCGNMRSMALMLGNIATIDNHAFDNCNKMETLHLGYNHLTQFPILSGMNMTLAVLYIDDNNIAEIPDERLDELQQLYFLDVGANKLTSFPNVPGPSATLRILYLFNNQFSTFPKLDIIGPNIIELRLDHNPGIVGFSEQDVAPLVSLTTLQLEATSIMIIPDLSVLAEPLEHLHLDSTQITKVSPQDMIRVGNSQLKSLWLSSTSISSLPTPCTNTLPAMDLTGTALDLCSCSLLWMKMVDTSQIKVDSIQCSGLSWDEASYQQLYEVCTRPELESPFRGEHIAL